MTTLRYFLDFEFIEDGETIDPLSLGIVCQDGRELYLENVEADLSKANDWVRENVFPHMRWDGVTRAQLAGDVLKFVNAGAAPPEFWGYYCVAPDTQVLTADLTWISAGDVRPDDGLMGFDEESPPGSGRSSRWRQWRRGEVTAARVIERPCYDLTFDDGTGIRCSAEHQWLVNSGYESARWITTELLVANGPAARSCVVKPVDVWSTDLARGGGYLAAAFDGEGHIQQCDLSGSGRVKTYQTRLGFAQRDNEMLAEVQFLLAERGFRTSIDERPGGVTRLTVGNRNDVLRLLGSIRPHRLLGKFDPDAVGAMSLNTVRLVEKTFVGSQEVVAMTTSTDTYIAEGLASHNCDYDWVALCQLYGSMVDLPKSWPMFCMDLKQLAVFLGNPKLPKPDGDEHHALVDARWNRDTFDWLADYSISGNYGLRYVTGAD